ncbi:MAG: DUF5118 domain-containing protein, partial [Alkalinema sp. CAN_BIN05]|nr:DUF5118 domain-containing protein [Alkalinema sp. CAN_BIN05]
MTRFFLFRLGQRLMRLATWRMILAFSLGFLVTMVPSLVQAIVVSPSESNSGALDQQESWSIAAKPSKSRIPQKPQQKPQQKPRQKPNAATQQKTDSTAPKSNRKSPADLLGELMQGPSFEIVTKKLKKTEGLFTLYRNEKDSKLLMEVFPEQINRNYLAIMTLESAIGQRGLYAGLPVGEFLFNLRRVNDTIQFVVPNTYIRSDPGSPISRSVGRSFSDSPLEALKIIASNADRKSVLIDL